MMRTDLSCALGNAALLDLDTSIYIEEIREEPATDHESINRAHYGSMPLNEPERESLTVTITLFVKQRDPVVRAAVIQRILAWAGSGWLTISTRPCQQIYVMCTHPPSYRAFERTERIEIGFTAYGDAYWQDVTPVSVSSSSAASSATVTIHPNGNHACFLEAQITPSGGALTSVTIASGGRTISLTDLSVPSGTALKIYYDEYHLIHIESGNTSLLNKRTAASADDILLEPGADNTVSLTLSRNCSYVISAKGLYK